MRHLVLTVSCVFAAGSALASSIETVTTGAGTNRSIAAVSCPNCPPLVVKKKLSYIVPEIANGIERVELKQLNGKMKLVRTESWLGGSPVVFITTASEDVIKAAAAKNLPMPIAIGAMDIDPAEAQAAAVVAVDTTTKTSAVGTISSTTVTAKTADIAGSREFDPAGYELRLK
ncbi:plant virulence effector HPE1-like domain-containing protein [Pararhizobium antarcticum]|uniref:Uncharacterized protein n=1 Tax=Pararhizobium antarcticum TaxID=1798805 RepID=A0A657LQL9_9HYPH|nr:plant virulence effector HPE1-like domain-containing protein [Pararhizobium antarcticum]OJF94007.1 hypothetical protein AX760_20980 [Pararhizobium antarcticum]OJF97499.1 hypothetical protein AX761_14230 [Rhizobium sp. 58]